MPLDKNHGWRPALPLEPAASPHLLEEDAQALPARRAAAAGASLVAVLPRPFGRRGVPPLRLQLHRLLGSHPARAHALAPRLQDLLLLLKVGFLLPVLRHLPRFAS